MKLGEYLEKLQALATIYGPNIELIYSQDEEGNYFDYLHIGPEPVHYANKEHSIHNVDDEYQANVICIN